MCTVVLAQLLYIVVVHCCAVCRADCAGQNSLK